MGESHSRVLAFGDCELDFARRELRRDGAPVELQPTPLRVLLYLAEHRDRTVPKQELLDAIWPDAVVGDSSLAKALANVREAVGDDGDAQRVIRTQRGAGVRFVAEASESPAPPVPASDVSPRPSHRALWVGAAAIALAIGAAAAVSWQRPEQPQSVPFGLAVLPIANLSRDERDQALADGLTEQITHATAASGYPVVARTTSTQWRERGADVRKLGDALGVSHVLEGSLQRDGDRFRVTLQLISTATGKHIWSEVFEEPSGDAFAIQDRVTNQVAQQVYYSVWEDAVALERDPARAEIGRRLVEARRIFNAERYDDYFDASDRLLALLPETEEFAGLRATMLGMVSISWANLYASGPVPFAEAAPKMLAPAEAAVAAAPDSAWAHGTLSRALAHLWRWEEAERSMRRACELAPRDGLSCGAFKTKVCLALGCLDEAIDGGRMWVRTSPAEFGAFAQLGWALSSAGELEEAERVLVRARAMWEGAAATLPFVQWQLGKRDEAVESLRRLFASRSQREADLRELDLARAKAPEAVWRWAAEREESGNEVFTNQALFAAAHHWANLGEWEKALSALERSVAKHEAGLELFGLDPAFDPIRGTKRFRAMIEKMGLTAYHSKYLKRSRFAPLQAGAERAP